MVAVSARVISVVGRLRVGSVRCRFRKIMENAKLSSDKTNSHQVSSEGRSFVESELRKRGAGSVISEGTRKVYLQASNSDRSRTVQIQVKTKRKGNWHSKTDEAEIIKTTPNPKDVKKFWVFVDLSAGRRYWVVPDWWIRNDIHEAHQAYLERHGGRRAKTLGSNHHSIDEKRLEQWQDKWETLGIFG